MQSKSIAELWYSRDPNDWQAPLKEYWALVQPQNVELEQEMEKLDPERIRQLTPDEWFAFLHDVYFRWKYTAANRYATTTAVLRRKADSPAGRISLDRIKSQILAVNPKHARIPLEIASQIPGLGTAGASGLLALLFPAAFGTVDQFVVKALLSVPDLPEANAIARMNPEGLTSLDGDVLIRLMRRQATLLTNDMGSPWRPRDVDKVLWTFGRD